MKSLKEIYNLSYDTSNFSSSLINWYNKMIDKYYEELDVIDVSKMIRQDILKDVALKKAIDLFIKNPYDGEFTDGDLINTIVSQKIKIDNKDINKIKLLLYKLEKEYLYFNWCNMQEKNLYLNNIYKFKNIIINSCKN